MCGSIHTSVPFDAKSYVNFYFFKKDFSYLFDSLSRKEEQEEREKQAPR